MQHIELYALKPANRTAGRVVSQSAHESQPELSKKELVELSGRLLRKQRLIKKFLGISSLAQHKNLKNSIIHGSKHKLAEKEPRLVSEYKRIGEAIAILETELARQRAERRRESEELEAAAKARAEARKLKNPVRSETPTANNH